MRLTISGLGRAESCIGSVVLPGIDESGEWSTIGTAVDRFAETAKTKSREAALIEAPEELQPYLEALTLERIPDGAEYQVAFAWNVLTGEVRRIPNRSAGYPADLVPEWILGTTDIVGVRDGRAVVFDLKWGSSTIGRDPADDLQLGGYALCVTKLAGVSECEVGFLRAGWDGVLRPESAVLDGMALDAMEARIVSIWKRAQEAERTSLDGLGPKLHVGDWCRYCPARRSCPAMVQPVALALRGEIAALASDVLPSPEVMREKVEALSIEAKGRLYERLDAAVDYLLMIKGILRDDARKEPLPLSGGKELREVLWGARKASPEAKEREKKLEEDLRAAGLVETIKVQQVRPMKRRA
jgi:hypothetical protein